MSYTPAIAPSILSCDFTRLADELVNISSADYAHVDVMDNHFVPNLTFGLPVVGQIVKASPLPVDAHLMIENPDEHAPAYADAGCAIVTFQFEAASAPIRLAREIRSRGARVGLAINPGTAVSTVKEVLAEVDMLLIMTVEPGFGGQSFLTMCLPKIREAKKLIDDAGLDVRIQVDGGVSSSTIEECAAAGADTFVAGSAVYGSDDVPGAIKELRELATQATA